MDRNFTGYYDYELRILSKCQKIGIAIGASILLVLALMFNISAFLAHMKRKIRPLFRTCLISLTISDLITIVFMYANYITQMTNDLNAVWKLGDIMCGFIPFATTTAILVNSFTLVSIALDRYLAIVRFVRGTWNPSTLFCTSSAIMIWGIAAATASPLLAIYHVVPVQVMQTDPGDPRIHIAPRDEVMCMCDKDFIKYYYTVVFVVIFLPFLMAFLWLYLIIAKEIWHRRRPIQPPQPVRLSAVTIAIKCNENERVDRAKTATNEATLSTSTTAVDNKSLSSKVSNDSPQPVVGQEKTPQPPAAPPPKAAKSRREVRQVRMFNAILILMTTFLICRLPTWSYLVYKSNYVTNTNMQWMLNFCFGLLSMTNSVMNPLLYTFLTETIELSLTFVNRFCKQERLCCGFQ